MLDIDLFRANKGGNPELIRESVRRRFGDVAIVDDIIPLDAERIKRRKIACGKHRMSKEVRGLIKDNKDASPMIKSSEDNKILTAVKEAESKTKEDELHAKLALVGNLVHDSVFISNDKADNQVIRTFGELRNEPNLKNHVDLVELLDIVDMRKGSTVAGGRGYYLKNAGVLLNQALINYGLSVLENKGYELMTPPDFMKKEVMARCAQLSQFDEELYKVEDDLYLIATAEQPMSAYHMNERLNNKELPKRYAADSPCFRKEAGSHGRDTGGIFRVHQFDKVEQFCITSPDNSWEMLEEMIHNSEEFYQSLKLPYQVVSIVSGALNDAAAKKYDLEAWFPASKTYRELVSCSNCTDYQARKLEICYGQEKKQFVHMLNSTLTATQRTLCCILENYQKEDGVEVPEVLIPFMGGKKILPFKKL